MGWEMYISAIHGVYEPEDLLMVMQGILKFVPAKEVSLVVSATSSWMLCIRVFLTRCSPFRVRGPV